MGQSRRPGGAGFGPLVGRRVAAGDSTQGCDGGLGMLGRCHFVYPPRCGFHYAPGWGRVKALAPGVAGCARRDSASAGIWASRTLPGAVDGADLVDMALPSLCLWSPFRPFFRRLRGWAKGGAPGPGGLRRRLRSAAASRLLPRVGGCHSVPCVRLAAFGGRHSAHSSTARGAQRPCRRAAGGSCGAHLPTGRTIAQRRRRSGRPGP